MKKNKFVKLIEHILVALPLLYVGGVALYTMVNENAKDSYYGVTTNEFIEENVTSVSDFVTDTTYYFNNDELMSVTNTNGLVRFEVSDVVYRASTYGQNINADNVKYLSFYSYQTTHMYIVLYDANNNSVTNFAPTSNRFYLEFKFYNMSGPGDISPFLPYITYRNYIHYSTLDSALPYAMSEFNKLGFNKIPFTSFFVNIFHNGETNVYIDFVNNYLNYMLFVECSYFVPMILYWFIHLGEDVVDRFTRKGDKL